MTLLSGCSPAVCAFTALTPPPQTVVNIPFQVHYSPLNSLFPISWKKTHHLMCLREFMQSFSSPMSL